MTLQYLSEGRVIIAIADEAITPGDLVKTTSSHDVVTAARSTYVTSDIHASLCNASGDNLLCMGIAGASAATNDFIPVYTEGMFIVRAAGSIAPGNLVAFANSTDPAEVVKMTAINNNNSEDSLIGRAYTGASAADAYLIVRLRA